MVEVDGVVCAGGEEGLGLRVGKGEVRGGGEGGCWFWEGEGGGWGEG